MSKGIISSFNAFKEMFGDSEFFKEDSPRMNALSSYFERGGVISVSKKDKGWPKLIYPSIARIREQKKELEGIKKKFEEKKSNWEKKKKDAENYHAVHNLKKLTSPLYWKHKAKCLTDKEYKNDADLVKLPAHLVSDPKWTPMVKMFVNDIEYRKQLTETVENSVVYKDNKKVARYADELQDFRKDVSSKEITLLIKKLESTDALLAALSLLESWAKE
ncbi:MAG: hypothetical protein JW703_03890 [Candidatus Diapherotrites archaeon]|nr:hypothetical protein [Candidatus Diapherotrites archaeon]